MPSPERPSGCHPERWNSILQIAGLVDKFGQPLSQAADTASGGRRKLAIVLEDQSHGFRAALRNPGFSDEEALQRQPLVTVRYGDYPNATEGGDSLLKQSPTDAQKTVRVFEVFSARREIDGLLGESLVVQARYLPMMESYHRGERVARADWNFIEATPFSNESLQFRPERWASHKVCFNAAPQVGWPELAQTEGLHEAKKIIEQDTADERGIGGTNDKLLFGIFGGKARFVGGRAPGGREPKGFSFAPSWTPRGLWEGDFLDERPNLLILPYQQGGGCAFMSKALPQELKLADAAGRESRIYMLERRLGPYFAETEVLQYQRNWTVAVSCHG